MLDTLEIDGPDLERARRGRFVVSVLLTEVDGHQGHALVGSITETLERYGVRVGEVVACGRDPAYQSAAIARIVRAEPSLIISRPTAGAATTDAHRDLRRLGVRLVLLGQVPPGLLPGRDFDTIVASDEGHAGTIAARILSDRVTESGIVGILGDTSDPLAGSDAERAFRAFMKGRRADARIVVARFGGTGSPGGAALRLLADEPTLGGLFVPAEEAAVAVVRRLRAGGLAVPISTVGLGPAIAVELAVGGMVAGVAARQPWQLGSSAASAAVLALLGRRVPDRIVVPPVAATRADVLEVFSSVWHEPPPQELVAARWSAGPAPR